MLVLVAEIERAMNCLLVGCGGPMNIPPSEISMIAIKEDVHP
jgi:hypothetical protein